MNANGLVTGDHVYDVTVDDWDIIHDALAETVARATADADMWRGRRREKDYLDEALRAQVVLQKIRPFTSPE